MVMRKFMSDCCFDTEKRVGVNDGRARINVGTDYNFAKFLGTFCPHAKDSVSVLLIVKRHSGFQADEYRRRLPNLTLGERAIVSARQQRLGWAGHRLPVR